MSDLLTREQIEGLRQHLKHHRALRLDASREELDTLCDMALLALKDEPEPQQQQPSVDLAPTSSGAHTEQKHTLVERLRARAKDKPQNILCLCREAADTIERLPLKP